MTYDSAYWSYGWTAQSMGNTYDGAPITMPPPGLALLTVTCAFYSQNGKPDWGSLTFTPSVSEVVLPDKTITLETIPRVILEGGMLPSDFALLMPDDSNTVTPASWSWNVTGRIGPENVNWTIPAPSVSPYRLS